MVIPFLVSLLRRAGLSSGCLGFTGHSFRQGGAQSLFDAGVSVEDIKIFGRWKSYSFRLYIDIAGPSPHVPRTHGECSRLSVPADSLMPIPRRLQLVFNVLSSLFIALKYFLD
jgi:hypothetical protein